MPAPAATASTIAAATAAEVRNRWEPVFAAGAGGGAHGGGGGLVGGAAEPVSDV
jgi:hypothetical protein